MAKIFKKGDRIETLPAAPRVSHGRLRVRVLQGSTPGVQFRRAHESLHSTRGHRKPAFLQGDQEGAEERCRTIRLIRAERSWSGSGAPTGVRCAGPGHRLAGLGDKAVLHSLQRMASKPSRGDRQGGDRHELQH